MYLKRHKVGEDNPKMSGKYQTDLGLIHFGRGHQIWLNGETQVFPTVWYSEVTERLYTETEMLKSHSAGRENMYQAEFGSHNKAMQYSFEEFISQLNKDKDK